MRRLVPLAAVLLAVSGCGANAPADTTPAPPPLLSNQFSGVLTLNGGITHPFTVTGSGTITVQLISLMPDAEGPIGLSIGTWNGSSCQIILANDLSIQGSVVIGQTTTVGNFCVRVYDAAGTVVEPETYIIEVTHQ